MIRHRFKSRRFQATGKRARAPIIMANTQTIHPPATKADVIVVAEWIAPQVSRCLQTSLERSGPILDKMIVITGSSDDSAVEAGLPSDSRVRILPRLEHTDEVSACNWGLAQCSGDVVILPATASVSDGWIAELAAAAHSEERSAFAWPLSSAESGRVLAAAHNQHCAQADSAQIAIDATSGLPRWTTTTSVRGECVYLRGRVRDAVGLLDTGFQSLQAAIADWAMRAHALGFFGKRANHVWIEHARSTLSAAERVLLDQRHPYFTHQSAIFDQSIDGRVAQHAIEFLRTGKIRVAYDIRHVESESAGCCNKAIKCAEELARHPKIDLSFLVYTPEQADGLGGRIIRDDEWRDEFAVIHKPAPFLNRRELETPFCSSGHVVISFPDMNTNGTRAVRGDQAGSELCTTTTSLSLLCASGIQAYSQSSAEAIATELGIPIEEIAVAARECSAQSTFELYRSAVLRPTERSLQMRRLLRDAILSWSRPISVQSVAGPENDGRGLSQPLGVRAALKSLNAAVGRRVGREVRRLHAMRGRGRY
jgi:hypothetical protein